MAETQNRTPDATEVKSPMSLVDVSDNENGGLAPAVRVIDESCGYDARRAVLREGVGSSRAASTRAAAGAGRRFDIQPSHARAMAGMTNSVEYVPVMTPMVMWVESSQ